MNELRSYLYSCTAGILSADSSKNENDSNQSRLSQPNNFASQIEMDGNSERIKIEILEQPTSELVEFNNKQAGVKILLVLMLNNYII